MYSCNSKAEFQQPLLQSSGKHDPSEIILIFKEKSHEYWLFHSHNSEKKQLIIQISLRILLLHASNKRPLKWLLQQPHTPINKTCQSHTDKTNLCAPDSWIMQQSANYNETFNFGHYLTLFCVHCISVGPWRPAGMAPWGWDYPWAERLNPGCSRGTVCGPGG